MNFWSYMDEYSDLILAIAIFYGHDYYFCTSDVHLAEIAYPAQADSTADQQEEKDVASGKITDANELLGEGSAGRSTKSQLHQNQLIPQDREST